MTEVLISVLVFAGLFVAYGWLNRGGDRFRGCGHCDGSCADESECKVYDLGEYRR